MGRRRFVTAGLALAVTFTGIVGCGTGNEFDATGVAQGSSEPAQLADIRAIESRGPAVLRQVVSDPERFAELGRLVRYLGATPTVRDEAWGVLIYIQPECLYGPKQVEAWQQWYRDLPERFTAGPTRPAT